MGGPAPSLHRESTDSLIHVHVHTVALGFLRWSFSLRCSSAVCGGCIPETTISRLTLGYIKPVRPEQVVHTRC